MSFRKPVTKREFAREIFVGVMAVVCLFAIFLFVAIQKSTGRSLSPLAYLWPDTFKEKEERIPVVVFRTEEDRHQALMDIPVPNPYRTEVVAKTEKEKGDSGFRLTENSNIGNSKPGDGTTTKDFSVAQAGFAEPEKKSTESKFKIVEKKGAPQSSFSASPPVDDFNHRSKSKQSFSLPDSKQGFAGSPAIKSDSKVAPANFLEKKASRPNPPNFDPPKSKPFEPIDRKDEVKSKNDKVNSNRNHAIQNSLRIQPEKGDTFWKISARYYGDGKYFRQLAEFNDRAESPDDIPNPVLVPPLKELLQISERREKKKKSEPKTSKNEFRTLGGETLFDISKEQLGSASRYVEIYKLNENRLPKDCDAQTKLEAGITLLLPVR